MKLFRAMSLSAGVFALLSGTASAQTAGRTAEPAAVVEINAAPVPFSTVSHVRGSEGAAVETACPTCGTAGTCATCQACNKEYVAKTKNGYEVRCKEYCVPRVRFFGILSSSCEEPIVKTRKVLIIKQVPDGTRPVYSLNGGASTGGPVEFRTPAGSAETKQPGATTAPIAPSFQSMPSGGGRTPSGSAETTQPGK